MLNYKQIIWPFVLVLIYSNLSSAQQIDWTVDIPLTEVGFERSEVVPLEIFELENRLMFVKSYNQWNCANPISNREGFFGSIRKDGSDLRTYFTDTRCDTSRSYSLPQKESDTTLIAMAHVYRGNSLSKSHSQVCRIYESGFEEILVDSIPVVNPIVVVVLDNSKIVVVSTGLILVYNYSGALTASHSWGAGLSGPIFNPFSKFTLNGDTLTAFSISNQGGLDASYAQKLVIDLNSMTYLSNDTARLGNLLIYYSQFNHKFIDNQWYGQGSFRRSRTGPEVGDMLWGFDFNSMQIIDTINLADPFVGRSSSLDVVENKVFLHGYGHLCAINGGYLAAFNRQLNFIYCDSVSDKLLYDEHNSDLFIQNGMTYQFVQKYVFHPSPSIALDLYELTLGHGVNFVKRFTGFVLGQRDLIQLEQSSDFVLIGNLTDTVRIMRFNGQSLSNAEALARENKPIMAYPNPSSGVFTIEFPEAQPFMAPKLVGFDMAGREVPLNVIHYNDKQLTVEVLDQQFSGLLFISWTSERHENTGRILISGE